jgi:pectate lyase
MRLRTLAIVVLLAFLILPAGCKSKKETAVNNPAGTGSTSTAGPTGSSVSNPDGTVVVSTAEKFLDLHREWTRKLESIADRVNRHYSDWTGGKITEEEYVTRMIELRKEMKELNKKTDLLTEFKLSDSDKQKVNYEAVYRGYLIASKGVNDFIEAACSRPAEEIKTKYGELIKNKYQNDMAKLKAALQM